MQVSMDHLSPAGPTINCLAPGVVPKSCWLSVIGLSSYSDPYTAANPDITIIWDESSAEAVAKLRAMNEAGNITWDLVDVEGADSIRLCD